MSAATITPMGDLFEEGIAKMERDLAAMRGKPDQNQVGIRLSLAIMPAALRAFAREVDNHVEPSEILDALTQTIANTISSALNSLCDPEHVSAAAAIFIRNLIIDLKPRLDLDRVAPDAHFAMERTVPRGGHA